VFQMDIAKVDRDVAYVAMVVHICCKCSVTNVLSVFSGHMLKYVYLDVVYVSHIYCMCFIWLLRMVAMVFKYFQVFFSSVLEACVKCFICIQTYVTTIL
jgi:hypothetical protein